MKTTTQKGKEAENLACDFLQKQGFTLLEKNFYTAYGEIDIIATKERVLHFFEVKSGSGFEPIYNISPAKMQKIIKSITIYFQKNPKKQKYCISAIILTKDKNEAEYHFEVIENISMF